MSQILVINGPNLNMLGVREPEIYGKLSLADINQLCENTAQNLGLSVCCEQHNAEHNIVELIQKTNCDFIIINPAAFTHTSVAIRDAIAAKKLPFIEVHLSNPHAREPFRQQSYFSDLAKGIICGFGAKGYEFAIQAVDELLKTGT